MLILPDGSKQEQPYTSFAINVYNITHSVKSRYIIPTQEFQIFLPSCLTSSISSPTKHYRFSQKELIQQENPSAFPIQLAARPGAAHFHRRGRTKKFALPVPIFCYLHIPNLAAFFSDLLKIYAGCLCLRRYQKRFAPGRNVLLQNRLQGTCGRLPVVLTPNSTYLTI